MNKQIAWMLGAAGLAASLHAAAQVTFYEGEGFRGRMFTANGAMPNFERSGGNDRASSVVVDRGSWDVCVDARYQGRCVTLRPGSYDSLSRMGLNNAISSVRPHDGKVRYDYTPEPLAEPTYPYRRRPNERLYEVPVTSVRAVVGPPNQRCWVEREEVRESPNVGGAVVGAILGGVLGHQVGSGRGNDVATVGGALAGGAIGSQAGRGTTGRDVQRCENVSNTSNPDHWDVTYNFRNQEHHAQLASPPGRTLTVNERGEPRG